VSPAETAAPQIYLATPPGLWRDGPTLERFETELRTALDATPVACLLLSTDGLTDDAAVGPIANRLAPIAQDRDVAFLIEGLPQAARAAHADGVHIVWSSERYLTARKTLGDEAIVGVHCAASRHDAMLAAEIGADYVAFDAAARDAIDWWVSLMEIPAVAFGATLENAAALAASGIDFVAVREAVWEHREGAAAALASLRKALAQT
jgi:thiamine-phosphate pyrophosphorylase